MIPSPSRAATNGQGRRLIGVVLLAVAARAVAAATPPVTVLLPPPPLRQPPETLESPVARAAVCLARHLRGWLDRVPQVRLVDDEQSGALLSAVTGPAWTRPPGSELAALAAVVPLDAVILWEAEQPGIVCRVQTREGERRLEAAYRGPESLPALLRDVTAFVARELDLDASPPPPADWPAGDPKLIEDCLVAGSLTGGYMVNGGTAMLDLLRPHATAMPRSAAVAAAFADAARWLTLDQLPVKEPGRYAPLAVMAVGSLIGGDREAEAIELCRTATVARGEIEGYLLEIVAAAGRDEIEAALDEPDDDADAVVSARQAATVAVLTTDKTPAQQAGAIRCLAAMRSPRALPHLARIAGGESAALREAVATALGSYADRDGLDTLARLADDESAAVAWAAAISLHRRGQSPAGLGSLARRRLAQSAGDVAALAAVADVGTADDAAALGAAANAARAESRRLAVKGLARLGRTSPAAVSAWLADPDAGVVETAVRTLPADAVAASAADLRRLGSHPSPRIAAAARERLESLAPVDPHERSRFDLDVEHPYRRRRIVEAWAGASEPDALDGLMAACGNAFPEIRGLAITRLAARSADRLAEVLPPSLADAHREVRLAAAAAAATTVCAIPPATIEKAIASETDPAVRAYLAAAAARLAGRPAALPPAVHMVDRDKNQTFLCGQPTADSPYDGFYGLDAGPGGDTLRRAHEAGKIFLPRANRTATSPAQVFFNPAWRDGFWLGIEEEFRDHLAWVDGVVLGEESMGWQAGGLWQEGWRLFCQEAGLDPMKVAGRWESLSPARQAAFRNWEDRVQVEAFNEMYERLKLRFGALRPGFQIGTFLPHQHGATAHDLEWRFDFSGGYDYAQGDNRRRYAEIRRLKTLWPDRPVIWLSQGRAGVGIALNDTVVRPATPVPKSPWHAPHEVTAVDVLTAWQAGGHSGLFAIYLFVNHADKSPTTGVWVGLGDLAPGNEEFDRGIERMFAGLAEAYETRAGIAAAKPALSLEETQDDDLADLLDEPRAANPHVARAAAERAAFQHGLFIEGRLVRDAAIVLAGIPFPKPARNVLLVGPVAATAAGFDLATDFDLGRDINLLGRLPLDDVRFLGLAGQDTAAIRDETVAAVARWLENRPGLLYIRGWACDEPKNVAFRAADPETATRRRWPWSGEVVPRPAAGKVVAYDVSGAGASLLGRPPADAASLVLWRKPGWRGAVLFDGGGISARDLGATLRQLQAESGIGIAWEETVGIQRSGSAGLVAVTSSVRADKPLSISGVDVLSGAREPLLPPGRTGVLTASDVRGSHLAAANGIAVVSERPLEEVEPVAGGVRVKTSGLILAVSQQGEIEATAAAARVAEIDDAALFQWLFAVDQPGLHRGRGPGGAPVVILRAPAGVTLTIRREAQK